MKTKSNGILILILGLVFVATIFEISQAGKGMFTKRYVFWVRGWKTQKALDENVLIMERAAAAGYNGILVANPAFGNIRNQSSTSKYFTNFKQMRALAKRLQLDLCPNYAYQNIPAIHDIKGSEAFPVWGTPFTVGPDRVCMVQDDPSLKIVNAGFEGKTGEIPTGWRSAGLTGGTQVFVDNQGHTGTGSVCFQNLPPDKSTSGLIQSIAVKQFRAYELKIWIKTEGFVNSQPSSPRFKTNPAATAQVAIYGNTWRHWVDYHHSGSRWPKQTPPSANQNWKEYRIVFCSMENTSVKLWIQPIGYHSAPAGKIWFDDISIREVGLVETVLRSTTPVTVKSAADANIVYQEGTDFIVDAETDYMAQGKLIIPQGSAIKPGDRLSVDWSILGDQERRLPSGAWCDKQAYQYLINDNLKMHELLGGMRSYHIAIGEWREAGWDPKCVELYGTAGSYMAAVTLGLEATCRLFNPKMDIYIKNDMYDPYHNAGGGDDKQYYMCNGPLQGSWNGITDSAIIMNWRGNNGEVGSMENSQVKSLMFWAGLDPDPKKKINHHRQIIRFNCQSGKLHGVDKSLANVAAAEKAGLTGVVGCVYNTWDGRYPSFEAMESLAQLCKDDGRWATNPCPLDHGCDYEVVLDSSKLVPPPLGVEKGRVTSIAKGPAVRAFTNSINHIIVEYRNSTQGDVQISLVNTLGQSVRKITEHKSAGSAMHRVSVNASALPSGIYFIRVATRTSAHGASSVVTRKIALL